MDVTDTTDVCLAAFLISSMVVPPVLFPPFPPVVFPLLPVLFPPFPLVVLLPLLPFVPMLVTLSLIFLLSSGIKSSLV